MDIADGDGLSAVADNYYFGGAPWAWGAPSLVLDKRNGRSTFYVTFNEAGQTVNYDRLSYLPTTAGDDQKSACNITASNDQQWRIAA